MIKLIFVFRYEWFVHTCKTVHKVTIIYGYRREVCLLAEMKISLGQGIEGLIKRLREMINYCK